MDELKRRNRLMELANIPLEKWNYNDYKLAYNFITIDAGWQLTTATQWWIKYYKINKLGAKVYSWATFRKPKEHGGGWATPKGALQILTKI